MTDSSIFAGVVFLYRMAGLMCLLIIPFAYVAWTGNKARGIRVTWILWFGFLFAHALFMPALARLQEILTGTTPDVSPGLALGVAILMGGLLGWIPGFFISSIAFWARDVLKFFKKVAGGYEAKNDTEQQKTE